MRNDITVILNVYNRSYTLEQQLDAIKAQTVMIPDENIWVFYNKGTEKQSAPKNPNHLIMVCNKNTKYHGRFALAMLAKTKYIALFDDDVIPGTKWLENCLASIEKQNGIYGGIGVTFKSKNYHDNHKSGWFGVQENKTNRVDLVGHAWFFEKLTAKYMWYEEPYSWDNAEDIMFSYLAQKYGNINTFVPPSPNNDRDFWCNTDGGKIGNDAHASYLINPTHNDVRNNATVYCIDNGWKTVNKM